MSAVLILGAPVCFSLFLLSFQTFEWDVLHFLVERFNLLIDHVYLQWIMLQLLVASLNKVCIILGTLGCFPDFNKKSEYLVVGVRFSSAC